MIQPALRGEPNLGYFLLDINSNKTLSWPPTAQPRESNKNIQSQAIKTASLDHITKPSVLSSSPPECLLYRYETSWNEEKETQWPVLWERKNKKVVEEGEREPDENWQPTVSVMPSTLPLVEPDALECQLTSCKHSTPVQRPSPRKLSLLNSCVIAGPRPRGAWCWGGVGQVGGVVNKGEALP